MLVITRRKGERLIIGHDIEVTVIKIRGSQVKLGIRGPADVPIHREELRARILDPSSDTSRDRTPSAGLTAGEPGEEEQSPPGVGSPSDPRSGSVTTMLREPSAHAGEAADRELQRRIKNFLEGRNLPALRDLEVEVRNGAAVITGSVRTFYHKQLATSCCQRVAGVLSVVNEVQVTDAPGTAEAREDRT